jgi:pimeloyl-ACP methyl ester carboxylesterase
MKQTLILIPGFANNEIAWKYQIEHLIGSFDIRIFVMDRFSTRQEMVDFLLSRAPERFHLAGHSMGGWVAQAVAARAPMRVNMLLLFNTWATPDPQMLSLQNQVCNLLKDGKIAEAIQRHLPLLIHPSRLADPALIHALHSMIASFSLDSLVQQLDAMLRDYSSLELHASISAPTLVVHSCQDALFPKEYKALIAGIKNSHLAQIEECGHASIMEKPEETTDLMRSFIENGC